VKRLRRGRAQAMVEQALVLPIFLLLTIGVIDFSRAIWSYNTVEFLARDGARYGVVPSHSASAIKSHVSSKCGSMLGGTCYYAAPIPSPLPSGSASISVTRGTCGNTSAPVVVTVTYQFQPVPGDPVGLISGGLLAPIALQATSQMYVESAAVGGCAS
jgi:Flp pilus assembly protein TadG